MKCYFTMHAHLPDNSNSYNKHHTCNRGSQYDQLLCVVSLPQR